MENRITQRSKYLSPDVKVIEVEASSVICTSGSPSVVDHENNTGSIPPIQWED